MTDQATNPDILFADLHPVETRITEAGISAVEMTRAHPAAADMTEAVMADPGMTDPGFTEQAEAIGRLQIADSGDVLTVDVIHHKVAPDVVRVAGARLTPQEAASLASMLLSASGTTSGAREGI